MITLTYFGAEKVVPHYNVMGVAKAALEATVRYLASSLGPKGIRVNAISAGPIMTLAGRGVGQMGDMLRVHADKSPLRRNVKQLEVGGAGASVPGQRAFRRDYRRDDLCRLRLQHHGFYKVHF